MKKNTLIRFTLLFFATFSVAYAQNAKISQKLPPDLKRLTDMGKTSFHSIRVSDGKVLSSFNSQESMTPASITKLVTALAVLEAFGPDHRFVTEMAYSGTRAKQVIDGDLIIVGGGDPYLVNEKLWQAAADLKNMGVQKITGNIVIDNSIFENPTHDKSRKPYKKFSNRAYDAPLTALGINFNTLAIAISPSFDEANNKAQVSIDPYPLSNISIINNITTSINTRSGFEITRNHSNNQTTLHAKGRIDRDAGIRKVYRSTGDPVITSGEIIRSFLQAVGIEITGKVIAGDKPKNSVKLLEIQSYPLSHIVRGMNKYSNNFIADMLTMYLGSKFENEGTLEAGGKYLGQYLKNKTSTNQEVVILNGSGLDTANKFTTEQMTKLLQLASKRLDIFPEFLASLPIAGLDGTLQSRFQHKKAAPLQGILRAKTGTLTQPNIVSALAGYYLHPEHGLVAFSVFSNGLNNQKRLSILDVQQQQEFVMAETL